MSSNYCFCEDLGGLGVRLRFDIEEEGLWLECGTRKKSRNLSLDWISGVRMTRTPEGQFLRCKKGASKGPCWFLIAHAGPGGQFIKKKGFRSSFFLFSVVIYCYD